MDKSFKNYLQKSLFLVKQQGKICNFTENEILYG